jgi:hypothetical protein
MEIQFKLRLLKSMSMHPTKDKLININGLHKIQYLL